MNTRDDVNGMNMIFGANGFAVESAESNVVVVYNPQKRQIDIRTGTSSGPTDEIKSSTAVSLNVEGKIYCENDTDVLSVLQTMNAQLQEMKKEIAELKEMMVQVYYAPGMPGYICAEQEFNELQEVTTEQPPCSLQQPPCSLESPPSS